MNTLGKQIMAAIDRSISGPPRDPAAETLRAAIGKQTICTPADKAKIIELDRQYGQAYQTVLDSDYPHAKQAFIEHQKAQVEMIAAGKFDNENFWTLEDFVTDFRERQAAGKRQMLLIGVAGAAISKPICETVARLLIAQADAIDQADQETYARYAVTFSPSPLSARLRQLAASVLARVSSGGGSRPKHYCPFLFDN